MLNRCVVFYRRTTMKLVIQMRSKKQQQLIDNEQCMIYAYNNNKLIDKLVVSMEDLAQTYALKLNDTQAYNYFKRDKLVADAMANAM